MTIANDECSIFDDILETIGSSGKFQRRFNFTFNFVLVFFASMSYMNVIYSIIIPDHWCKVPGREFTNFTEDEWKNITIPINYETNIKPTYEKCKMYNLDLSDVKSERFWLNKETEIVDCKYGWDYETLWYQNTAPSQENWVCNDELNVANSFAISKIGEVIGTLLFGQIGDSFGRKTVFFVTIVVITIGRSLLTVTANHFTWFLFFMFIGSTSSTAVFISPLIIAMEISRNDDRTFIAMLQCISWTFALCFMPMLMWMLGDWIPFMLFTTLPCALFLFSNSLIIESPRWLASKGKVRKCMRELEKIALVNNTKLPVDTEIKLYKIGLMQEKSYGIMSLFGHWRLAKNTTLLITAWMMTILLYIVLTLNVANFGGNPFKNYFWQGFAELPAYIVGKYACDYIGRRWTGFVFFVLCSLGCFSLIYTIPYPDYELITSVIVIFLKFAISLAFYAVQLQTLEIYPTCVRQSGQAFGSVMANSAAILGPYIVYLGTSVNATYPYILCIIANAIGAICTFFLPETLNTKLPETLKEAQTFGAEQKYFSISIKKSYVQANVNES